jgi:hypothetical protein
MRGPVALALVVGLLGSGVALGAGGSPKKQLNPADQARARAMLLRKTDLGPAFQAQPSSGGDIGFACAALDESDLTWTGFADSPDFSTVVVFASSESQVYESAGQASTAFRRDTSAAGVTCLRNTLRKEFAKQGVRLVSFRKIAFPSVSQRSAAYRLLLSGQSHGVTVRVVFDAVVLLRSRAEVLLAVGSVSSSAPRALEVRLARTLAARMKTAMRGA